MKISNMSLSNFKGNIYRYIMYILSNAFAVSSFFIFLNFLYHPAIDLKNLGGHYAAAAGAAIAVRICLFIIVGFSILFVYYANSQFIKARGKEIGLLSLYGMTKGQIRKYMFLENTILSLVSLAIGTGVGVVFSKLFLMIMERFIEVKLNLVISAKALGISFILFLIIFEIINIISVARINDKEIIEQIKSTKRPKELPSFSKWKAILGISLLIIGYVGAWIVEGGAVILGMIPITLIVILGTYFVVTEFSIYLVDKLNRNEKIKYKKTNIVSLSQLSFKLQDTAKVLFLSAILGAVTFTATETIFTFYKDVDIITGSSMAHDLIVLDQEDNTRAEKIFNEYKNLLGQEGIESLKEARLDLIIAKNIDENRQVAETGGLIKLSDYNKLAEIYKGESYELLEGETIYVDPVNIMGFSEGKNHFEDGGTSLEIYGFRTDFKIVGEKEGGFLASNRVGVRDFYIITDRQFEEIESKIGQENTRSIYGLNVNNKKKAYKPTKEFIEQGLYDESTRVATSIIDHVEIRRNFGMILFIGFFISFLFFMASGSIIYFKLFNEIKEDRVEYEILRKIGIKNSELNKIITRQIGLIFFIPFIISTVHSFFALKSLSNFVGLHLVLNGLIVMVGYLVFQIIYFIFIKRAYIKKLELE